MSKENIEKLKDFDTNHPYPFTYYHDVGGKLAGKMGVKGLPTVLVIDKEGTVRYKHQGFIKGGGFKKKLEEEIESLR